MDLRTTYMGLALSSPVVASASPLTGDLDALRALEDHGAGAVVLPSLFEEDIRGERGPAEERALALVADAKNAVRIPVIASVNCASAGWVGHARALEQAGADAIEIDVYFVPTDVTTTGREVERRLLDIVAAVRASVRIPIAVKIGPYFSALGAMARALAEGGADALVLFNRFYEPDVDLATLELSMDLELSTRSEIRLPLLWLAVLHGRVPASLAATTGVETAEEVLKYLLAGADVVMTTSSLLRHGVGHMRTLVEGLAFLLSTRRLRSVSDVRGRLSQANLDDTAPFERAGYVRILRGYVADD